MKASESEVFNRVVNRTLYSKKIVMAVMLATIMVGSAFMVAVSSLASSPTTPGLEGWTLHTPPPTAPDWTSGELKGYSEGDVVPVRIILYDGGSHEATVTVGFEWGYGLLPTPELRGYDHVVMYNAANDATVDPSAPYNVPHEPAPGDGPFCIDTTKGTITDQTHVGTVQDGWRIWDEWTVKVSFIGGNSPVDIRAGGLLYTTTETQMGASWFPGASLHVRLMGKGGANDLPINVLSGVLTPPIMQLHKFVRPDKGAAGDTLQFEVELINMGQANANLVSLVDYIPLYQLNGVVEYKTGSSVWWDSRGHTIDPFSDPTITVTPTDVQLTWDLTGMVARGTGLQGADGLTVNHLLFEVKINDVPAAQYINEVKLTYTDDHNGVPTEVWARASFCVVKPAIEIEKIRIRDDMPGCAAGLYDSGGLEGQGLGDIITYQITVKNPGTVPMQFEVEDAWLAPVYGTPIWAGTIEPGDTLSDTFTYHVIGGEERAEWNDMFRNTANVKAWDAQGHMVIGTSHYDIDILHPDATITKTADREIASRNPAETIQYTITVKNTGDTKLWYEVYDQFDGMPSELIGTGTLEPMGHVGDTQVLYDEFTSTENTPGPLLNTATLLAHDIQDHKLKRTSTESVDFIHPGIDIDKMAIDPATAGNEVPTEKDWVGVDGLIYYYFTITNPSNDVTMSFMCFDNLLKPYSDNTDPSQSLWGVESLAPGAHVHHIWILNVNTYTPPITTDVIHNQVDVYAWWNPSHPENRIHDFDTYDVKRTAKISGHVYHDINYDAKWNTLSEEGLGDFTVELWDSTQTHKLGTRYSATGGDVGYYEFASILPGTYWVKEIPLSGYFITNGTWHQVSVVGGDSKKQDIGNQQFSSIWNWKWYDWNMGGSWDDSEVGINGWTIQLTWISGPFAPPEDQKVRTTPTVTAPFTLPGDPAPRDGYWAFADVYPGVYKVEELYDSLLWKPTTGGTVFVGEPPVAHMTPGVYDHTEFAPGQAVTCTKFGNVPLTTVTGYKFYDKDMDGTWDQGEPALDGVIVTLNKWCNEHQAYEEVQRTTPLGTDGKYVFTGVTPGDYKIGEVFPASFPYGKTADWYCTNPNSLTFSIGHILGPQVNPGIAGPDMGNMRYAKVRGYMFEDSYGPGGAWPDGKYDQVTETGFVGEGFRVRLEGWTSGAVPVWVQRTVRTWAPITNPVMGAGNYRINELVPGTYTVKVWQGPEGDYFTTTPISYKIVIPAYYGGSTEVLYEDLNFGYVMTSKDPVLPFTLLPGWNLWSTPMVLTPSMTARDLLLTIGPQATIIMKMDKATGLYTSYKLTFPLSKNFPIVLGEGYYIWAQQEVSFKLRGEFSDTSSTTLLAGWNMIGHDQLKPIQASELLSRANACGLNARIVMYLDASTGTYHSYKTNFPASMNFWLEPGSAYYLWVDTPGQLVNP